MGFKLVIIYLSNGNYYSIQSWPLQVGMLKNLNFKHLGTSQSCFARDYGTHLKAEFKDRINRAHGFVYLGSLREC